MLGPYLSGIEINQGIENSKGYFSGAPLQSYSRYIRELKPLSDYRTSEQPFPPRTLCFLECGLKPIRSLSLPFEGFSLPFKGFS